MGLGLKPYIIRRRKGVYVKHMVFKQCLYGDMNYMIMGLEHDIGGWARDINAHGEMWLSILGFGSLHGFGHAHRAFLCSTPMRCNGVKLR